MAQSQTQAVDVDRLPTHMQATARNYVLKGQAPGGFLRAVLENDFAGAVTRGDVANQNALDAWAMWLMWDVPAECWGDAETVSEWIESGGLQG